MDLTKRLKQWVTTSSSWRLGVAIGLAVVLVKLPLMFTTLGEDDQGRLLMGALVYLEDGSKTLRQYGIFTSPLWSLMFAGVAAVLGTAHLVLLSNVGGLLCGGLTTALALVLLRQLGASRAWAAAGALAAALIPGTFYLSLYGYPSQYAVPLLLASTVAFAQSLRARDVRRSFAWYGLAAAAYVGLVLMKVDFALSGTFLLSVAIISRKTFDLRVWLLPALAVTGLAAVYVVTTMAIEGRSIIEFGGEFGVKHPWRQEAMLGNTSDTILYACGFATVGFWIAALIAGLVRRGERVQSLRIGLAWAIAVVPLWVFWLAHPPMSARHTVPGALATALLAALMASHVLKRVRHAPFLWLIALVAINWPFGEAAPDFNYRPTGNLARGLMANRRALAVTEAIAVDAVTRREPLIVIVGPRKWDEFHGIDFVPAIEIALASRSRSVHAVAFRDGGFRQVFTAEDGFRTRVYPYLPAKQVVRLARAFFVSPWQHDTRLLEAAGASIKSFNPEEMLGRIEPAGIYRFFATTSSSGESPDTSPAQDQSTSAQDGLRPQKPALVLFPNAPNPFSESTVISFRLSSVEEVTISVHPVSGGQPVFFVELPNTPAGLTTYRYDGRDDSGNLLPSGTYFYQVKARSAVQRGKLQITR